MKSCCDKEISNHLRKNRDVARCDTCGALILAYSQNEDYEKMIHQLKAQKTPFQTLQRGAFKIVIKP